MKPLTGYPASPGLARGTVRLYQPWIITVEERSITPACVENEEARLHDAVTASISELERTKERVIDELKTSEAEIIDAHLSLLQDRGFLARIKDRMVTDLVNVEKALAAEVQHFEEILAQVENDRIAESGRDVRDIGRRMMRQLAGHSGDHPLADLPEGTVIVAPELLPTDTLAMDRQHVAALVTEHGGATSHTAILARALGIPLVTGVERITETVADGDTILVDGAGGQVTISPSSGQSARFRGRRRRFERRREQAIVASQRDCETTDGQSIRLLANLNDPDEATAVDTYGLDGVGLFRTEFLYLRAEKNPSLATHARIYSRLAETMGERACTIRTFDLGADKLSVSQREAQTLDGPVGNRGLRFALEHRTLFRAQLRGLARAAASHPNLRVLFPMVVGGTLLREVMALFRKECEREGLAKPPLVGAMIETPAAVFDLEAIIGEADFLSVGTNDLTQYMMAISRDQADTYSADAIRHPSMLRALKLIRQVAADHDCPISICGEAAGDPELAQLFVGLGYTTLSMSPIRAPEVHAAISGTTLADCTAAVHAITGD